MQKQIQKYNYTSFGLPLYFVLPVNVLKLLYKQSNHNFFLEYPEQKLLYNMVLNLHAPDLWHMVKYQYQKPQPHDLEVRQPNSHKHTRHPIQSLALSHQQFCRQFIQKKLPTDLSDHMATHKKSG